MHASNLFHAVTRRFLQAGLLALLLTACDGRSPAALPPQTQLVEPLQAAYQQFAEPSMATLAQSCDTAPTLAQSLDGWVQAVQGAGLASRFEHETADAKQRIAAIRNDCPAATATTSPKHQDRTARKRARNTPRPTITDDSIDAYLRGIREELTLMRANNSHFVTLSKYDEEGLQVAATAGLPLDEYVQLRRTLQKVLHEQMMHDRYAGAAGQARLEQLEPHTLKYAKEVLARDPYDSLLDAERKLVRPRMPVLQEQYRDYLSIASVGG